MQKWIQAKGLLIEGLSIVYMSTFGPNDFHSKISEKKPKFGFRHSRKKVFSGSFFQKWIQVKAFLRAVLSLVYKSTFGPNGFHWKISGKTSKFCWTDCSSILGQNIMFVDFWLFKCFSSWNFMALCLNWIQMHHQFWCQFWLWLNVVLKKLLLWVRFERVKFDIVNYEKINNQISYWKTRQHRIEVTCRFGKISALCVIFKMGWLLRGALQCKYHLTTYMPFKKLKMFASKKIARTWTYVQDPRTLTMQNLQAVFTEISGSLQCKITPF